MKPTEQTNTKTTLRQTPAEIETKQTRKKTTPNATQTNKNENNREN